jgi:hypothetical protein
MKSRTKPTTAHPAREFIDRWRRAGPELERIELRELRDFDHGKNHALVDSLLQLGCDLAIPRTTSGLVELQRWLAKARR